MNVKNTAAPDKIDEHNLMPKIYGYSNTIDEN